MISGPQDVFLADSLFHLFHPKIIYVSRNSKNWSCFICVHFIYPEKRIVGFQPTQTAFRKLTSHWKWHYVLLICFGFFQLCVVEKKQTIASFVWPYIWSNKYGINFIYYHDASPYTGWKKRKKIHFPLVQLYLPWTYWPIKPSYLFPLNLFDCIFQHATENMRCYVTPYWLPVLIKILIKFFYDQHCTCDNTTQKEGGREERRLHKSYLYLQGLAINKYNCVHKILLTLILKILTLL